VNQRRERNRATRRKEKKGQFYLAGVAICALACFCGAGIWTHHSKSSNRTEIETNIQTLLAMETRELPTITPPVQQAVVRPELDPEREQEKILALTDDADSKIYHWFTRASIVGDSITEGVEAYGWLDDTQVFAKIGASVSTSSDIIQAAEEKNPAVMILAFGLNDIISYGSNVDQFIEVYTTTIQEIQEELSDTAIYVCGLLPGETGKEKSSFVYREEYNTRLSAMCDELDAYFVDGSFILEAMPELYDADGIHPKSLFYRYWLTYLADMTGLSYEDE
jgi:lysophospholipase L1-like esterase